MIATIVELEKDLYGVPLAEVFDIVDHYLVRFSESAPVTIAVIFFLFDVLLYSRYSTDEERIRTEDGLKRVYREADLKFSLNSEYLFFVGYFSAISPWLFGEDGTSRSKEKVLLATQLAPSNRVYQWAYGFMINDIDHRRVAREICETREIIEWIKSFGAAGRYIHEAIEEDAKAMERMGSTPKL
jgi:hypothetical protein